MRWLRACSGPICPSLPSWPSILASLRNCFSASEQVTRSLPTTADPWDSPGLGGPRGRGACVTGLHKTGGTDGRHFPRVPTERSLQQRLWGRRKWASEVSSLKKKKTYKTVCAPGLTVTHEYRGQGCSPLTSHT